MPRKLWMVQMNVRESLSFAGSTPKYLHVTSAGPKAEDSNFHWVSHCRSSCSKHVCIKMNKKLWQNSIARTLITVWGFLAGIIIMNHNSLLKSSVINAIVVGLRRTVYIFLPPNFHRIPSEREDSWVPLLFLSHSNLQRNTTILDLFQGFQWHGWS